MPWPLRFLACLIKAEQAGHPLALLASWASYSADVLPFVSRPQAAFRSGRLDTGEYPTTDGLTGANALIELGHKRHKIDTDYRKPSSKLKNVQATFTALDLAY